MRELRVNRRRKRLRERLNFIRDRLETRHVLLRIASTCFIGDDREPFAKGSGKFGTGRVHSRN